MNKPSIIIYTTPYCGYCLRVKQFLNDQGLSFEEIEVDKDPDKMQEMISKTGRQSVPQIFINGKHIGGHDELFELKTKGQLDELLNP